MESTVSRNTPRTRGWGALAGFLVLMFGAGAVGAFVTYPEIPGWYAQLPKPSWTPPNAVFAPVWNTIFLLTAVSGWLCWRRRGLQGRWVVAYGLQAVLNTLWSVAFFGFHSPAGAVPIIFGLLAVLIYLAVEAWRIRPAAGALLLPYVAWVSFASALNLSVAAMN